MRTLISVKMEKKNLSLSLLCLMVHIASVLSVSLNSNLTGEYMYHKYALVDIKLGLPVSGLCFVCVSLVYYNERRLRPLAPMM